MRTHFQNAAPKSLRYFLTGGLFLCLGLPIQGADWPQWAGPDRDFRVDGAQKFDDVADLKTLWKKPLGQGYSSIVAVDDRLYTVDREGDTERIVCLSAGDGETLWTYAYDAPHLDGMRVGYGTGPHGTPLLHDGRLFVTGTTGVLHALSAADGELLWKKDLWGELDGTFLVRGYASSPLAHGENVIVTVGGEGRGFVAFDGATGEERWRGTTFENSQSSPVLVDAGTAEAPDLLLVGFVNDEIVAADPENGDELWRVRHKSGAAYNIVTPVFDPEKKHLFVSSAYGGGTRGLEVSREGARELWHTGRMKVQYTNIVYRDGRIYGTSGNVGTVILSAVDTATGEMLWKDRDVNRAQLLVLPEGRLLALQDDGELMLLEPGDEGVEVISKLSVGEEKTWTIPTVVGQRIYLRNEGSVTAFGN